MSESVQMPALGESVTEGTVTQWLKSVGDTVEVDEPLLEVSTDKVDTEIPSPVAGVLEKILVDEDETVEVGADLAVIGDGEGGDDSDSSSAADDTGAEQEDATSEQEDDASDQDDSPADDEGAEVAEESFDSDQGLSPVEAAGASGQESQESDQAEADQAEANDVDESKDSGSGSGDSGGGERTAVNLPELGESVTEGTVTQWLKAVGDEVEVDEPLLEISTDKVDTEIPSPVAGTLLEIVADEDETVEVGSPLAYVGSGDGGGQAEAPAAEEPAPAPAEERAEKEAPADAGDAPDGDAAEAEGQDSAAAGQAQIPEELESPAQAPSQEPQDEPAPKAESSDDAVGYVTPLVRKLAADKGVDLADLTGSGVGGRIRKQDVLAAAEAAEKAAAEKTSKESAPAPEPAAAPAKASAPATVPPVSPLRGTREKMSRLRKIVASRMVESLKVSAQLTTVVEVDVTNVARLRARAKDDFATREGAKLTYLPFFALAATEALKAHPKLNASIDGDEVIYHGSENVGIAVDTERGLVVPVIKEAGDLNIAGIARKIADLAERTRANKVTPDELSGGTFTLTNTGSGGALFDTPILLQPQVGMLGIGTIVKRPVVVDVDGAELIAVRSMVYLALSYDHRLIDGADAARFLTAMKQRLEEGKFEAALGL